MTGWEAGFAAAGLVVTLVAVVLTAWLAARNIARSCMRLEHKEIAGKVVVLDERLATILERLRDADRRFDRIESHLGWHRSDRP